MSASPNRADNAAAAAAPAFTFREKAQAKTRAKREASAEAAAAAKAGLQLARQQTKAAKTVRDAPLAAHHREHADNGHAHEGGRLGGVLARMLEAPDAEAKVRAARAGRPVLRASVAQSEWASMDEALYATCAPVHGGRAASYAREAGQVAIRGARSIPWRGGAVAISEGSAPGQLPEPGGTPHGAARRGSAG